MDPDPIAFLMRIRIQLKQYFPSCFRIQEEKWVRIWIHSSEKEFKNSFFKAGGSAGRDQHGEEAPWGGGGGGQHTSQQGNQLQLFKNSFLDSF